MTSNLLSPGREISILIDYATAHCAIGVSHVIGRITHATDKAIEVTTETESGKPITFWLPRRALTQLAEAQAGSWKYIRATLAKWFNPTGWTARAIELSIRHNTLSA